MNLGKTDLFNFFDQKISKKAIQKIDGEWMVTGKYCRIGIDEDGLIDVWICNHKDLTKGLGMGALRNRLSTIFMPTGTPYRELTGEGWGKLRDKQIILNNLSLLGIRKKRSMSEEHKQKLFAGLERAQA